MIIGNIVFGCMQMIGYNKFPELIRLWNDWRGRTMFLSTGNCDVQEWFDLVSYGKEHPKEVAEFIYDMFENNVEVSWPQMKLYNTCVNNPIVLSDGEYINPMWESVQNAYKLASGVYCGRMKL